ncbi:uncharacterized protein LY79DRAFT_385334 [Colletotrichum navitas]|uniref:Secreted protein n=1 Tax=Colletotrichum navitas TaxID=681940 RepID=A0AAD8Q7Q7_9PEZI|nr:uncharacterized protein LY79DRAFT_385334 [Colletotrichum navitas]KAK1597435.1 hypothetical protein LY79DRAFT_385334 [Colletotrichum navitas]
MLRTPYDFACFLLVLLPAFTSPWDDHLIVSNLVDRSLPRTKGGFDRGGEEKRGKKEKKEKRGSCVPMRGWSATNPVSPSGSFTLSKNDDDARMQGTKEKNGTEIIPLYGRRLESSSLHRLCPSCFATHEIPSAPAACASVGPDSAHLSEHSLRASHAR